MKQIIVGSGPGSEVRAAAAGALRRSRWTTAALRAPRAVGRLGLALVLGAVLSGCVVVKPYQRERLSERSLAPGFGDRLDVKFRAHWEGSRQGADGGFGEAGGGCGCN